jgi:hypothetical protein
MIALGFELVDLHPAEVLRTKHVVLEPDREHLPERIADFEWKWFRVEDIAAR